MLYHWATQEHLIKDAYNVSKVRLKHLYLYKSFLVKKNSEILWNLKTNIYYAYHKNNNGFQYWQ